MQFGHITKVLLIGGGNLVLPVSEWCKNHGIDIAVYTSPRHANEILNDSGMSLSELLRQADIDARVHDDINSDPELAGMVDANTFGLALGPAWIFKQPVLDLFTGRLVNFHPVPLPRYRGGAHFTWQILQGDKTGGLNLQLITRKLDAGAVIAQESYALPANARRPVDYFDALDEHALPFLETLLGQVTDNREFVETLLEENHSLYMPRLSTADQGYINWAWQGIDILKFIDAFDEPYPGASTFLDAKKVRLLGCELSSTTDKFHPFQTGLIFRRHEGIIYVATNSGTLSVSNILFEDGSDAYPSASLGRRLHTPIGILEGATKYAARYTAGGLKISE